MHKIWCALEKMVYNFEQLQDNRNKAFEVPVVILKKNHQHQISTNF